MTVANNIGKIEIEIIITNHESLLAFDEALQRIEELAEDYAWLGLGEIVELLRKAANGFDFGEPFD